MINPDIAEQVYKLIDGLGTVRDKKEYFVKVIKDRLCYECKSFG